MADNKRMILNLFAGMQDALFLGDKFANGEFVAFLQPGQFISTNLKETPDSDDMAIQAEIADILVDSSYVNNYKDVNYSSSKELPGSVSQVYNYVLNHQALPYVALSPDVLAEIADLQNWLETNRGNYEIYRDRYFDAIDAYETEAHKQIPDGGKLRRLAQKKLDAAGNWDVSGQRRLYEIKLGRLVYLTAEDPSALWAKLGRRFQDNQRQAPNRGPYYQTFLIPSVAEWATAGWATFQQTISEQDTYEYSKSTSWSGGISGGWGLFSFGGGASGSTDYKHRDSSVSKVSLKFDYLRVRIDRRWLVDDVFGYQFWTWRNPYGGQMISDGGNLGVNPPIRPIGRMPVLTKYFIVIRNVELSASFSTEEGDWYRSQIQCNASVGWGPFSLSGSYQESTSSARTKASFDGNTFKIDQPQIIARSGLLLHRSPNPRHDLPWQGDQWFPDADLKHLSHIRDVRTIDYDAALTDEHLLQLHAKSVRIGELWLAGQLAGHEPRTRVRVHNEESEA